MSPEFEHGPACIEAINGSVPPRSARRRVPVASNIGTINYQRQRAASKCTTRTPKPEPRLDSTINGSVPPTSARLPATSNTADSHRLSTAACRLQVHDAKHRWPFSRRLRRFFQRQRAAYKCTTRGRGGDLLSTAACRLQAHDDSPLCERQRAAYKCTTCQAVVVLQ